jgi:hypothetical protein
MRFAVDLGTQSQGSTVEVENVGATLALSPKLPLRCASTVGERA